MLHYVGIDLQALFEGGVLVRGANETASRSLDGVEHNGMPEMRHG